MTRQWHIQADQDQAERLLTLTRYRLFYKADAGHVTYTDYKRRSSAFRAMHNSNWPGWTPTHIEQVELS
jgi:hypothetical protein